MVCHLLHWREKRGLSTLYFVSLGTLISAGDGCGCWTLILYFTLCISWFLLLLSHQGSGIMHNSLFTGWTQILIKSPVVMGYCYYSDFSFPWLKWQSLLRGKTRPRRLDFSASNQILCCVKLCSGKRPSLNSFLINKLCHNWLNGSSGLVWALLRGFTFSAELQHCVNKVCFHSSLSQLNRIWHCSRHASHLPERQI